MDTFTTIDLGKISNLKEAISSEENSINTKILKIFNFNNSLKYQILRYDRFFLSTDLYDSIGLCRSLILDDDNKVLSYSPPKTLHYEYFKKQNKGNLVCEEFVEGTMINLFWDERIGLNGSWEMSTRNKVGAGTGFFLSSEKITFRELFLDILKEKNIVLESFDKKFCYSFVIQHPKNRIVIPIIEKRIYLVGCYQIIQKGISDLKIQCYNSQYIVENVLCMSQKLLYPVKTEFVSWETVEKKNSFSGVNYNQKGDIIKNIETGKITKIRNANYEEVKSLRGNNPKLQYQYLNLRSTGDIKNYLQHFPEHKSHFNVFKAQLHAFTDKLNNFYVEIFITKVLKLENVPFQYKILVQNLHKIYIDSFNNRERKKITKTEVIKYVNKMPISQLMYSLNYDLRKQNIHIQKEDMLAENNPI
jgi:hypothetical protein